MNPQEISFIDIFETFGYSILIPAIQRDYAQGRTTATATKIRKDFVEELKDYLLDGTSHSLDFIYGYGKGKFFIPLDGQQRLTTLWLLHLYLGCMTNRSKQISTFVFNYETRDSSARFCEKLLENAGKLLTPDMLLKNKEDSKPKPGKIIKDEGWWFTNWSDDPTISGMLTMLDEIDAQFYDANSNNYTTIIEAGDNLFNQMKKPIVFQFMPLSDFHDIDDLYIKMNARGLPLTSFEIFKSKLIEDVEREFDSESQKNFKSNIDVVWSDVLWKYRNNNAKNIDIFLERALRVLMANEGVMTANYREINDLDQIFEANGQHLTFAHNWYEKKGIKFNYILLNRLISDLDVLFNPDDNLLDATAVIPEYDIYWFDISTAIRQWILHGKDINGDEQLTYDTRLKLHAYLKYKQYFPDATSDGLTTWMKLIHNLVEATPIDNSEDIVKALKSVETILNLYKDNYTKNGVSWDKWLESPEGHSVDFFASYQWNEEIDKAKLRLLNPEWRAPLETAEKHSYLNGQIGITMYLAGVYKDISQNRELNETITAKEYSDWVEKNLPLFTYIGNAESEIVKQYAMVKAMLAKGDYMPWLSSWRKNFYNRPGHRDYSWKRLFRLDDKPNMEAFKCLKEIINDPIYNISTEQRTLESLNEIGNEYQGDSDWKRILLGKYGTDIMRYSKQGFIAFDNNNTLIYHASQRNHYHYELWTLALYEELKHLYKFQLENGNMDISYSSVKSGEDYAYTKVNNYYIYHWISDKEIRPWTIEWNTKDEFGQEKNHSQKFSSVEDVLIFIQEKQVI